MTQSRLLTDGMPFVHCEHAVHQALSALAGVASVQVTAAEGIAVVEHDDRVHADQVAAAVTEAGYAVRV